MIIVSQNKNVLVNFDNVENIYISQCYNESTKKEDFTFDIIAESGLVKLGKYKTEGRAKEVLQEIIIKYRDVTVVCDINNNKYEKYDLPKVFEMPKE